MEQRALVAMVDRPPWTLPRHSARTPTPALYSPPKKYLGRLYGEPEPSGAIYRNGAHIGLGSEAEALLGHDEGTTALLGLDMESWALSGFTQELLPYHQQERQAAWEWPPRP